MNGQRVRRERKLIACLALLTVLVYGAVFGAAALERERGAEQRDRLAQLQLPESPAAVEMVNDTEPYVLTRGDGGWICQGNEGLKINSVPVSYMTVVLKDLEPYRTLPDGQAYLERFGLTEPAAELTLRLSGGSKTYRIGGYNAALDAYYMTVDGGDCVFLIGGADMRLINRSLLDLIAGPDFVGTDVGSITGIHVQAPAEYTAERTGGGFLIRRGETEFERSEYAVSGVYAIFNSAPYACRFHDADGAVLAACGLDEPEVRVEFTVSGGGRFLLEAGLGRDGFGYVREDGGGTLYQLSPEYYNRILERLDPSYLEDF